ncbi:subunit of the ESCRT-III complex [Haematococcus lacustris]
MSALLEKMGLGKKPDVKEQVRNSQREIRKGTRDIDRDILELRRAEAGLLKDIKAAAKANNEAGTRTLAKSLIRLRSQITKLQGSKASLQGVSMQMTTAATTSTVAKAVGAATKTMTSMQQAMNPQKVSQTMQQFSKENARMEMTQEMVGDAIDGALDDDEVEEETSELVSQVLDEIGVDIAASMQAAPTRKAAAAKQAAEDDAVAGDMDELATRLANLKSTS